jgi:hypothetical protein
MNFAIVKTNKKWVKIKKKRNNIFEGDGNGWEEIEVYVKKIPLFEKCEEGHDDDIATIDWS